MRIGLIRLMIAIVPLALMVSCDRPQPEPDLPPLTVGEISADALWSRISVESDYADYSFWPGHEGENPGQSPHGPVHRIYVNRTLLESLPAASRIAPNGSVIVKDNLNAARELEARHDLEGSGLGIGGLYVEQAVVVRVAHDPVRVGTLDLETLHRLYGVLAG